jgi:acyl carrier protein
MNIKEEKLEEIQLVFRKVFKDDTITIDFESNSDSIKGWDSITNIMLIDSLEEKFKIEFPIEVIFESKNIGDWINYIISALND